MNNLQQMIVQFTKEVLLGTLVVCVALYGMYLVLEPVVSNSQSSTAEQFEVTQVVTEEITFTTAPADVALSPALSGITGGTSNGATQMVVRTNNSAGYQMTLQASSSIGMIGDSQGGNIPALVPAANGVPDYNFSAGTVAANTAAFAYSVEASTTSDVDPSFRDNGSNACNTGANNTANQCWLNASTTPETVINRATATPTSGATTTLKFRVVMQSNPSPTIDEDTYTATTTVTATTN